MRGSGDHELRSDWEIGTESASGGKPFGKLGCDLGWCGQREDWRLRFLYVHILNGKSHHGWGEYRIVKNESE